MMQGKAIAMQGNSAFSKKPALLENSKKGSDADERYKYLLKHGIVKRIEGEDKIIFAELPQIPDVLVVYRKQSERNTNPERLNLDKRELTHLPLLEGEERLRLLNFQHNQIEKLENLVSLPNLIFLDLYNNQIREITHLHTVPTLRVLMLGKNRIERIRNLNSLTKLDILDLHSNRITKIENLSHLVELKVLNLANNLITIVENVENLASLTEINVRRNLIENVTGLDKLAKLQKVFLATNKIENFEQIACLKSCMQLAELSLESNPVASLQSYLYWVYSNCLQLKYLDLKKLTPEIKDSVIQQVQEQNKNSAEPASKHISQIVQGSLEQTPKHEDYNFVNSQNVKSGVQGEVDVSPEQLLSVIQVE